MSIIKSLKAREILDSRGNPTIEVECTLLSGVKSKSAVPSGASTGSFEAFELRDGDKDRFGGLGVLNAVNNINVEINNFLKEKDFEQSTLDLALIELDGTKNKSRLGANAILGVSLAFASAKAKEEGIELYEYVGGLSKNKDFILPTPSFNVINGGKHSDSGLDIQEFMICPQGFETFHKKVEVGHKIIATLKNILIDSGYTVGLGDEGGFAPKLHSNEEALILIKKAITSSGFNDDEVKIAIDVAANSFYKNGLYVVKIDGEMKQLTSEELINWYEYLVSKYNIFSIEDGLAEEDWDGFILLKKSLGDKVMLVGDDLTVTNIERINLAISKNAINSVLIKLNQIGTLSETIEAVLLVKNAGLTSFISHRSGETEDTFIADLCVGLSCPYIKAGSLARGERISKYNRIMEIEDGLLLRN